ncbi:MAG: hypothetical protein Q9166_002962 [cf. Caloplaca sp. 2 TL-2023]
MKIFGLSHLLVLLHATVFSCITAIPTTDSSASESADLVERFAESGFAGDFLTLSSELFAIQLVSSYVYLQDYENLCEKFDISRLHSLGYNITSMKHIWCQAFTDTYWRGGGIPDIRKGDEIQALTTDYSSWIWIYQAIGALDNDQGRLKQLCESINVTSSFNIGQNGTLVKTTICNAAAGIAVPSVGSIGLPFFDCPGGCGRDNYGKCLEC